LAKKHEKHIEIKETKLEDIKSRNEVVSKKFQTVIDKKETKEYENIKNYLANEKKRIKKIEKRNKNL
jgi:hypothetical protein